MASWELELHTPPTDRRALELWLQNAAGRILFEDVRSYAAERIDPSLSIEARTAAQKGIDDALYGLMMVIDGVSGAIQSDNQRVELSLNARLINREPEEIVSEIELRRGEGMCMGYHNWLDGDYGEDVVATPRSTT
jgi:hypothetical protein